MTRKWGWGTGPAPLLANPLPGEPIQQHMSWGLGAQGPDTLGGYSWEGVKGPSPAQPQSKMVLKSVVRAGSAALCRVASVARGSRRQSCDWASRSGPRRHL